MQVFANKNKTKLEVPTIDDVWCIEWTKRSDSVLCCNGPDDQ